jgi:hypothetical protein
MTVYVVHEVKDDLTAARRFGELRYINRFYIHGDELERSPDEKNVVPRGYLANMRRCVEDFGPNDYLLIAGDHLQLLALTALLVGRFQFLDVLRWDRQLRDYIPVRLSSGIVPPRPVMLASGTDIGDRDHDESRSQEDRRQAEALALDGPHRPRRKPPAQDDH